MKRCPQCSQVYTDDMMFCLSDGTPLIALLEPEEPTVVRPTPPARGSSGVFLKVLAAGAFLLFGSVLLAGIAVWMLWPRDAVVIQENRTPDPAPPTPTPVRTATTSPETEISNARLRSQQEELDRERRRLADERKKLEEEKRKANSSPEPPQFRDPGTTRIAFRRGSVGETVSGSVAQRRSFVLRTLAGQRLIANVRSPGGCVTFEDGGTRTAFQTGSGDSFLNIRNSCTAPASFALSVTVR